MIWEVDAINIALTKTSKKRIVGGKKQRFYNYLFILSVFMFLFIPLMTTIVKGFYIYDDIEMNVFKNMQP